MGIYLAIFSSDRRETAMPRMPWRCLGFPGSLYSFCRHRHECGHGFAIHEDGLVVVVGKENSDDMGAEGFRTMAEASLDQLAAEIAVHAIVGPSRDVAGISLRIDFHVDVAAFMVIPALKRREEREIAFDNDADGLFGVAAQFDNRAGLGPDDFEHGAILCLGRCKRKCQERQCES